MNQYMAHSFYIVPIHSRVTGTVFKSQLINSFSYYFDMFHQTEIDYRICNSFLQSVLCLVFHKYVHGLENVLKPFDVSNFFSHK